jgi:plastocyanin
MLKKYAPFLAITSIMVLAACGGDSAPPAPSASNAPAVAPTPAAPAGYQVAAVTGGGGISGTVTVTGDVPEAEVVEVNKDNSVCGDEKTIKDIQVGDGGVLANAVVWIDDIKSGKDWDNGSSGSVDQNGCSYMPHIQALAPGAKLEVVNSDAVLHNIHAYAGDETLFNIAQPIQGMKTSKTLEESGPVHLKCDVHSWMSAWVFVAANPYYAITATDGSFSLGDVPAGTYSVKIWHGRFGEQSGTATVEADGTATVDFEMTAS